MFSNVILDIAIGLIFLYLVLSLLCTVVNEFIATNLLNLRAANLAAALHEILDDPRVRANFYNHGIIRATTNALMRSDSIVGSLVKNLGRLRPAVLAAAGPDRATPLVRLVSQGAPQQPQQQQPQQPQQPQLQQQPQVAAPANQSAFENHVSYLASSDFALAVLGSLDPSEPVPAIGDIQTAVNALPDSNLKTALLVALSTASNDLETLRNNIANWFDNSMDRMSGAYKRHLKFISIVVGLAVAVIFNADTLKVGTTLWTDNALRAQIVQAAEGMIQKSPQPVAGADQTAQTKQTLSSLEQAFTQTNNEALPLPIGWKCSVAGFPACLGTGISWWTPIGWFLTGLALSLGAPFWFDLLSMFMNLRGAGVKPQRADKN